MTDLFGSPVVDPWVIAAALDASHYLGAGKRGFAWSDEYGVMLLASPTSRRLPHDRWLELVRWCLTGEPNAGSRQWAAVSKYLRAERPDITTVVSYSDPSVGHTGALYRACNWLWAPTWHRLRPPPTGNGSWDGATTESTKDRWVFCLRPDVDRERVLALDDPSIVRRMPWAEYREKTGGDYKRWIGAHEKPIV